MMMMRFIAFSLIYWFSVSSLRWCLSWLCILWQKELEVVFHRNFFASSLTSLIFFVSSSLCLLTEGVFKVKPSDNNAGLMTKYDGNHPIFSYHSPHGLLTSSSLGLITPLIVSSLILVLIIVIACIVCSKDSFLSLQAFHRSSNISHRHHESPGSGMTIIAYYIPAVYQISHSFPASARGD